MVRHLLEQIEATTGDPCHFLLRRRGGRGVENLPALVRERGPFAGKLEPGAQAGINRVERREIAPQVRAVASAPGFRRGGVRAAQQLQIAEDRLERPRVLDPEQFMPRGSDAEAVDRGNKRVGHDDKRYQKDRAKQGELLPDKQVLHCGMGDNYPSAG